MYVYVNKKIDNMITIASQRGKINLGMGEKNKEKEKASSGWEPKHFRGIGTTHVKVSASLPMLAGSYHAEKATIAGICKRQT